MRRKLQNEINNARKLPNQSKRGKPFASHLSRKVESEVPVACKLGNEVR